MKKIIICTMMLIITTASFSQQTQTPTLTKQDYLLKSKHQKKVAWILLCGGILSSTLGSIQLNVDGDNADKSNNSIFLVTGLTSIGISIPLFTSSSKNKKKATSLSFKNESIPQISKNNFVYKTIPSLNLKISL